MIIRSAFKNSAGTGAVMSLDDFLRAAALDNGGVNEVTAMRVAPVAAAHRILTNSIGNLPIHVFQKRGGIGEPASHTLDAVLGMRSNERMSPFIVKKLLASSAFWHGDGFALIERDRAGRVFAITPLPCDKATPYIDEKTGLWYGFSVDGQLRKFHNSQLIHVFFETFDGITGRGMLDIARETIGLEQTATQYAGKFYKNGARVSGIIEVPGKIDKDGKQKVREAFEGMASGMDNAFRVAVLDAGLKYTQLGISQSDAQFIETRAFTVAEISRYTGIPLHKLQEGKQSYNSNEQQGIEYVATTLQPIVTQWEQEWSYKLFSESELAQGYYLRFNMAAEMRGDNKSRAEFYEKMLRMAIYSPDECRALEEKGPIPGGLGSHYWMSKNYDTLENMMEGNTDE